MNLKKFREDHLLDLFRSYAKSKFPFGDQDILNICLQGHVGMLPVRLNYAYSTIGLNTIENGCSKCDKEDIRNRSASIIHFAGLEKPWKHVDNRWEMMWYRYVLQLPKSKLTEKYIKGLNEISDISEYYDMQQIESKHKRILLYGFTYISRDLIDRAPALGISKVSCFCDADRNKQGTVYKGIPCISVEEMIKNLQDEDIIIICSQKAWKEIYRDLRNRIGIGTDVIRYVARGYELVGCE